MAAIRTLQATFTANINGLSQALNQIQQQVQSTANSTGTHMTNMGRHFSRAGDGLTNVGKKMSLFVTAPLAAMAGASLKTSIEFEAQMSRVGAIAGATAGEMDLLRDAALELGASSSKSASEVAIAQEGLAAMGFTTQEILGAMPGVIAAAEASGADMAQTADVIASSLNIFGLEASEASRVADILAQTANQSAADITDMQYALKYAGGPAASLGVSLEELSASIGIMTDAGLSGENAGTALRGAMLGLLDPSEENSKMMEKMGIAITDNEGNFVGLSQLVENLSESMEGQTETQKAATLSSLVGKEAVSGMLALMAAGPEKIDKMTASLENSGGASAEAAAKMKDNLKGAIDELGGAIETAAITIGGVLTPYVQKATTILQGLVQKFIDMSPQGQKIALMFAALAAAAGPLIVAAGFVASAIGSILTIGAPVVTFITAAGGLGAAFTQVGAVIMAFATGPIAIAVAAIAGIVVAGGLLVNHLRKDAVPEVDRFGDKVSEKTKKALEGFFALSDGAQQKLTELKVNGTQITEAGATELISTFGKMNEQIVSAMKKRHDDQINDMENFFMNSSALTTEKEEEIVRQQKIRNDMKVVEQGHFEDRIQQILELAAKENRALTDSEAQQINEIQKQMQENAVEYLTESEMEQKIIMERLASSNEALSARQAAAVVKNSADARDKVIKDADKKYNDVVAFAIRERDETGSITAKQAEDIIAEAKKTRDTTVGHAEDAHEKIVTEAKEQAGEHVDQVNWQTGEILTKWGAYKQGVLEKFRTTNSESMADFKRWGSDFNTAWNDFNGKAQVVADNYKTNVKKKFTDFNTETAADFSRWASNFNTAWTNFDTNARRVVDGYKTNVKKRFTDFNTETAADFSRWASNFNTAWTNFDSGARKIVDGYYTNVKRKFTNFNTETANDFRTWASNFSTGWNNFNTNAQQIVDNWKARVKEKFVTFFSDTKRDFSNWGSNIRTFTSDTFNNIRTKISDTWNTVKTNVSTSTGQIFSNIKLGWSNILSNTRTQFTNIYTAIRDRFNNIVDGAKALPGRISDGLKSMASKVGTGTAAVANAMASTLEKGVNGVINGINSALKAIGSSAKIGTIKLPRYAYGTKDGKHPGGLAVVGDGTGSNAGPELVETPDGKSFLTPATPTIMDLPKGTKVYSATVTRELGEVGHLPHYAWGDMLRSAKDWVKDKVASGASALMGLISNPTKMLESAMSVVQPSDTGLIGGLAAGGFKKVKSAAITYLADKIKSYLASLATAGGGTNITSGGGGVFPSPFRLTSAPGMRLNPVTKVWAMHNGWDYGAPAGTPIPAQAAGTVTQSGFHAIRGNYVRIRSADGYDRIYQHNTRNSVGVGAAVKRGQTVGTVGATGRSKGAHLHYEILKYANGGIVDKEQLAHIAEGGWAESIISHDPAKRATQGALWQKTGEMIGMTSPQDQGLITTLLQRIADAVEAGHGHPILMNDQVVAEILKDPITRLQQLDQDIRSTYER